MWDSIKISYNVCRLNNSYNEKKKRKMFGGSCYMQVLILGLKERSFHSLWPQFSQPYGSSNIWRGPVKD